MPMATAPGDVLAGGSAAGLNAHMWSGTARASVSGRADIDASGCSFVRQTKKRLTTAAPLPAIGDMVTCRVNKINPRQASVDVLCVGGDALSEACPALIRREDVRPGELEPVEVYRSFRPGDIVLARVLSLGDARAYYLTSSEPELGVVLARSAEGMVMKPVSYCEMECPVTKSREPRKVAKPREPLPIHPAEQPTAEQPPQPQDTPSGHDAPSGKRRRRDQP